MDLYSFSVYTYLAFFTVLLSFCYHYCKDNRIKFLFLTILYIGTVAFWSIRYNIGFDYQGYVEIWNSIRHKYDSYTEPLFNCISVFFSDRQGYIWVFFIYTLITYWTLIYALKKENIIWPGMLMSLSFSLQFMAANQIRQALAICIILCLTKYIEERKHPIWIVGIIFIGATVHTSAFFLLMIIPLCYIRISSKTWFTIIVLLYILYFIGTFRMMGGFLMKTLPLMERFDVYTQTARMNAANVGFSPVVLFNTGICLFIAWFSKKDYDPILNLYMIGTAMYVSFTEFDLITRLSFYLTNFGIIVISKYCNLHKKNGIFLEISSLCYFILLCSRPENYNGVIPFQSLFDK